MTPVKVYLRNSRDTSNLGRNLSKLLGPGDVIILSGDLGAGKTTLVQGLAEGLGVEGPVTSPTFTLIQEFEGKYPLYHIDVYRLEDPVAAWELGLDEYFYGAGITVVEWGERLEEFLPEDFLKLELKYEQGGRLAVITAYGQRHNQILEELKHIVDNGG